MDPVLIGVVGIALWKMLQGGGQAPAGTTLPDAVTGATGATGAVTGSGGAAVAVGEIVGEGGGVIVSTPTVTAPVVTPPTVTPSGGGAATGPAAAAGPAGPPPSDFMLSDKALSKLSASIAKEVTKWFLAPPDLTMGLSPEAAQAWGAYRAGEWADYSSWADAQTPPTESYAQLDVANNAQAVDVAGSAGDLTASNPTGIGGTVPDGAATVGSEAGTTMSTLSVALAVIGTAACLVDIGFVITGTQSDVVKAIQVALDIAIIVCLWIPAIGWIVSLVLGLVKMVVGLFGGSGMTHAQREMMEFGKYVKNTVDPFVKGLAKRLSPREVIDYVITWGSGYCGGIHQGAIAFSLVNAENPSEVLGIGSMAPGSNLPNHCYWNQGRRYRQWDAYAMTRDEMAEAMIVYGPTDLIAQPQVGVSASYLASVAGPIDEMLTKKMAAWAEQYEAGMTLDEMDILAREYRKQPRLNAIAQFFGYDNWHDCLGWTIQDYWTRYLVTSPNGSVNDFARTLFGMPDLITLRDTVMGLDGRDSYGYWYDQMSGFGSIGDVVAGGLAATYQELQWQQASSSAP